MVERNNERLTRKQKDAEYLDDELTSVEDEVPAHGFAEVDDDDELSPSDRRRDPLRRKF
jgi:hypothetical protein